MKTTKILFYFLFLILFLFSCHRKKYLKDKYALIPTSERIDIELNPESSNIANTIQYFNSDGTNYLAMQNQDLNRIEIYNLDDKTLFKVIDIKMQGPNSFGGISSFIIDKMDSVIVITLGPKTVGIFDTDGNILKKIPFEKDNRGRSIQTLVFNHGQRPYKVGNKIYICQAYQALESFGVLSSTGRSHSYVNVIVDLISNECITSPLLYPEDLIGEDVFISNVTRTIGYKNNFVYHFGTLKHLFVTKDFQCFERKELNSNYDLKIYESDYNKLMKNSIDENVRDILISDDIYDIYYDPYRESYYLIIRIRTPDISAKTDLRIKTIYPHCRITILNKNLEYMGESLFPDDIYSFKMMFITQKGVFISEDHVNNLIFSEDYIRFRLFKLEKLKN